MSSWGHKIERLEDVDHTHLQFRKGITHAYCSGKGWMRQEPFGPKCPNPAAYVYSYRYVTGRAGRVTTREQVLCSECAEKKQEKLRGVQ